MLIAVLRLFHRRDYKAELLEGHPMPSFTGDSRPRVLIIDDEAFIAESLALAFRQHGFEARCTLSAEGALDLLKNWQPEIAIVDICLARMNGVEFALHLRDSYPECKLLLFSGRTDSDVVFQGAQEMGLEFASVEKPVQPTVLLNPS
jgi:DNA-binding response OmpR family regulator